MIEFTWTYLSTHSHIQRCLDNGKVLLYSKKKIMEEFINFKCRSGDHTHMHTEYDFRWACSISIGSVFCAPTPFWLFFRLLDIKMAFRNAVIGWYFLIGNEPVSVLCLVPKIFSFHWQKQMTMIDVDTTIHRFRDIKNRPKREESRSIFLIHFMPCGKPLTIVKVSFWLSVPFYYQWSSFFVANSLSNSLT